MTLIPKNAVDTLELVPKSHIPKDYRDFQKPFQYKEEKKIERKVNISLYFRIVKNNLCLGKNNYMFYLYDNVKRMVLA